MGNESSRTGQTKPSTSQAKSTSAGCVTTPAPAPFPDAQTTTKGAPPLARTIFIALAVVGVFFTAAMVSLLVAPSSGVEEEWSTLVKEERIAGRMKADDSTVVVLDVGGER